MSRFVWTRGLGQSIWNMPNIYAVNDAGAIADGCRPLESLDILYDMHNLFQNVLSARDRIQKGIPLPDSAPHPQGTSARWVASSSLQTASFTDPVRPAAIRYQQEHGEKAYRDLLLRLFRELIPAE